MKQNAYCRRRKFLRKAVKSKEEAVMLEELKKQVYEANMELHAADLLRIHGAMSAELIVKPGCS